MKGTPKSGEPFGDHSREAGTRGAPLSIMSRIAEARPEPEQLTLDPREAAPSPPFSQQKQKWPGKESEMDPAPDYGAETYRGHGRLEGRIALITGADSGIGRAVALAFAREGAHIAFTYLPEEKTDALESKAAINEAGVDCLPIAADLSEPTTCEDVIQKTVERFGRIDILVNNAAFQGEATDDVSELTPGRVEQTLRVNVLAPFVLVRACLPHMGPGGSIINVSSIQAYDPSSPILDYATSKGALVTFTKGLAQSLIERGIRVNSVAPGPVWTPLVIQSFSPEKNAHFGENSPMGRPAQPAELAPPFVFLASDESRYVNGEILGVTGGRLLA
jgi:NAD(P)-dependent dehydrogenase (short-subunit alcohol dehydrogenase family)